MNKKLVTTGLLSGILATGAASAEVVSVGPVSGIWTSASPADAVSGVDTNEISWGDEDSSSYVFEGQGATGDTNVDFPDEEFRFDLGTFTHNNFSITGTALDTAQLQVDTVLTIDGTDRDITSVFTFDHVETQNNADPCFGDQTPNAQGCPDRVTFSVNEASSDSVVIGGRRYEIGLTGFQDNGDIAEVFWTDEGEVNVATLRGVVQGSEIPVPATLPLYGLGLAGLGLAAARRRRH
ncbi:THxN family PEP-CTERM protein [Halorhodospira neutriphila]|uniref:PEP-CTERM protein-sorting domain-containing protein n=1 Tax=Halorhodospira neutriphila TaxID=168379 RepID=A0ABS1E5L6_9GAMM|nr:THxN family PEP-CTERM protein [Halorhodospira neutriphila]MBK1726800.1 hypothetical protein [Halorhodospira neutriphila]